MKNIETYKSFLTGLTIGLLIISSGAYATTTGAGTIGSLFDLVTEGGYKLKGERIVNNSITRGQLGIDSVENSELAGNSVRTGNIVNGQVMAVDLADNSVGNSEIINTENFTMNTIKLEGGISKFGIGNNKINSATNGFVFDSNSLTNAQLILRDSDNTIHGRLYGINNGQNFGLLDTNGDWIIRHDSMSDNSSVGLNGNVGIGTNSPIQKLDVDGKIRMRSQTVAADSNDTVATKGYVDSKIVPVTGPVNSICMNNGTAVVGSSVACANARLYNGRGDGRYRVINCQAPGYQYVEIGSNMYYNGTWQTQVANSLYSCTDGTILVTDMYQ